MLLNFFLGGGAINFFLHLQAIPKMAVSDLVVIASGWKSAAAAIARPSNWLKREDRVCCDNKCISLMNIYIRFGGVIVKTL